MLGGEAESSSLSGDHVIKFVADYWQQFPLLSFCALALPHRAYLWRSCQFLQMSKIKITIQDPARKHLIYCLVGTRFYRVRLCFGTE
jgi:hypothetical protein